MRTRGRRSAPASAFITEDRKAEGLSLDQSILDNALGVVRAVLPERVRPGPARYAGRRLQPRGVRAQPGQEVRFLSGGNQQKVVLATLAQHRPSSSILIDEPTRGIDVGAKPGVYELMRELTRTGVAILMISTELPEVIGMSDRIVVMRDGVVAGEFEAGPSEEAVLGLATGAATDEAA